MARYIAIPKIRKQVVEPEAVIMPMDSAARAERVETLTKMRHEDPSLAPTPGLEAYFENKRDAALLADPRDRTPLTGVIVIQGTTEDAAVLQEELPDHEVFEDFDIHLVAPVAVGEETDIARDKWHLEAVGLVNAQSKGFSGKGEGKIVAVLDTGIAKITELNGRIAGAWEVSSPFKTVEINTHDTDGHGTGVASLVAGKSLGIAPASQVLNMLMMPFRRAKYVDFLSAMEFIAGRPDISVANISAGLEGRELRMLPGVEALLQSGILPVVAVGNDGQETSRSPGNFFEVVSVGASTREGRVWSGSGSESIVHGNKTYTVPNVVAPGEEVTTCNRDGKFRSWNGSSMAAPTVSGLAVLITEKYGPMTLADLREEICAACEPLVGVCSLRQGDGVVQVPKGLWFEGA